MIRWSSLPSSPTKDQSPTRPTWLLVFVFFTHMHAHVYIHTRTCTPISKQTYTHTYTHTHTQTHTHTHTQRKCLEYNKVQWRKNLEAEFEFEVRRMRKEDGVLFLAFITGHSLAGMDLFFK